MRTNYYQLYIDNIMALAETIVIKSEYSASLLNKYCEIQYGADSFDSNNPQTWKYYLNISGQYHPEDEVITVVSLDTLSPIVFTKDNLALHPSTRAAYQYNTRYYRELLLLYPQHEQLILGILYPCDIDKAIAAKDFSVLAYPPHLVEENETTLISQIDHWLDNYEFLWNNKQFNLVDAYYPHACVGVMYLQLPGLITNLRLKACKTTEAHSYHVREYLASHGMLDEYLSRMTHKQALFFYRNINYIERNSGSTETFDWLLEKIMTDRGLPLAEYAMKHDISQMPIATMPQVTFRRRLLNTEVASAQEVDNYASLDVILSKESRLAKGNAEYIVYNRESIRTAFQNTLSATIGTKLLESAMVDYTDAVPYTLHHAALNHWMYYSQKGQYTTTFSVRNPKTGVNFLITAQDAYMYYLYAFSKSIGITLTKLPGLLCERIQRDPLPDTADLMKVVDTKYMHESEATYLLGLNPLATPIGSAVAFKQFVEQVHDAAMTQSNYVAGKEHMYTRGLAHAMISRIYKDEYITVPNQDASYTEWMDDRELDYSDFSQKDWYELSVNLYEAATGLPLNLTESTGALQKAMVSLFEKLSSYSIQFVTDINATSVKVVNWAAVRVGDIKGSGKSFYEIQLHLVRIFKAAFTLHAQYAVEIPGMVIELKTNTVPTNLGYEEFPWETVIVDKRRAALDLGYSGLLPFGNTVETGKLEDTKHFDAYFSLTDSERSSYKNVFDVCHQEPFFPTQINIEDLILTNNANGFQYQKSTVKYLDAFKYFYAPAVTYYFTNIDTEYTLSGFYANHNPIDAGAITYNGGVLTVPGMNYIHQIPIEITTDSMEFSGGWTSAMVFEGELETDFRRNLSPLHTLIDKKTIDFTTLVYKKSLSALINRTSAVPVEFDSSHDAADLDFQSLHAKTVLSPFKATTLTHNLDFVNTLTTSNLSKLQSLKETYSLSTFSNVTTKVTTGFNSTVASHHFVLTNSHSVRSLDFTYLTSAGKYSLLFRNTSVVFNITFNNTSAVHHPSALRNTFDIRNITLS